MTPHELHISPVLNGFYVRIGCQAVVFPSVDTLIFAIARYYRNPEMTIKEFIDSKVNDTMGSPATPAAPRDYNLAAQATQERAMAPMPATEAGGVLGRPRY